MPTKTPDAVKKMLIVWAVNQPNDGAPTVYRQLRARKSAGKYTGHVPSQRTIGMILKEARALPVQERRPYQQVVWPESFEAGVLPWEASAAYFELLRANVLLGPPLVPTMEWFWRVTLAMPNTDVQSRWYEAANLVNATDPVRRREIEEDMVAGMRDAATGTMAHVVTGGLDEMIADFEMVHGVLSSESRADMKQRMEGFESWKSNEPEQPTKAASTGAKTAAGSPRSRTGKATPAKGVRRTTARKTPRAAR